MLKSSVSTEKKKRKNEVLPTNIFLPKLVQTKPEGEARNGIQGIAPFVEEDRLLVLAGFSIMRAGPDIRQRFEPHNFFAYDCHVFTCCRRGVKVCGFCLKRIGYSDLAFVRGGREFSEAL